MAEQSHPTHIRDATEIYDASADLDNDGSHEDNAPIIYEMHRDVFSWSFVLINFFFFEVLFKGR